MTGTLPDREHPVSRGTLCVKGWSAHEFVASPDRLKQPLLRDSDSFRPIPWDEAIAQLVDACTRKPTYVEARIQLGLAYYAAGRRGDARDAFTPGGRSAEQQDVFKHVNALLTLRAARPDLRGGRTQHLFIDDKAFVYRRGASVIAINNVNEAVTVEVEGAVPTSAAVGACGAPVKQGTLTAITIPARSSCVF